MSLEQMAKQAEERIRQERLRTAKTVTISLQLHWGPTIKATVTGTGADLENLSHILEMASWPVAVRPCFKEEPDAGAKPV